MAGGKQSRERDDEDYGVHWSGDAGEMGSCSAGSHMEAGDSTEAFGAAGSSSRADGAGCCVSVKAGLKSVSLEPSGLRRMSPVPDVLL